MLAVGLRGRPRLGIATGLALLVAVGTHFAWSTAHFWGWLAPVKSYFTLSQYGRPHLAHLRPPVLSMTGLEKTPVLFGGDASLADGGAHVTAPEVGIDPSSMSWGRALAARAPVLAYLALFGVVAARSPRRRPLVAAAVACLAVGSAG